jgi:hypothetical protein
VPSRVSLAPLRVDLIGFDGLSSRVRLSTHRTGDDPDGGLEPTGDDVEPPEPDSESFEPDGDGTD